MTDAPRHFIHASKPGLHVAAGVSMDAPRHFIHASKPEGRKAAAFRALEYEEKYEERPVAGWNAQHGIQAFRVSVQYVPDAEWQAARSRSRAGFEKLITAN